MVKTNKQLKPNKIENISISSQKQPGFYQMIFIGILLLFAFFICLIIIFYGKFDPFILFLTVIFFILSILIFLKIPKRYNQISIDKNGIHLLKRKEKYNILFKDVEKLAPLIKIDRSWWNFSKYSGITIRKKGEKERFVVIDPDEVDSIYYSYLNYAPNAIKKELKKIPEELNRLHIQVQNGKFIKNCLIVISILLSMIITFFFLPDYNLRGDYFHWSMKLTYGFINGLLVVCAIILFFGYFFGAEFDAKIMAFRWRVNNLNDILVQNDQDPYYVDKSSIEPLEKITKTLLKETGIIMIIFGLMIIPIAINSMITSGLSSYLLIPLIGSSAIIGLGFAILKKSKSSPTK